MKITPVSISSTAYKNTKTEKNTGPIVKQTISSNEQLKKFEYLLASYKEGNKSFSELFELFVEKELEELLGNLDEKTQKELLCAVRSTMENDTHTFKQFEQCLQNLCKNS